MSMINEDGRPLSRIEEAASIANAGVRLDGQDDNLAHAAGQDIAAQQVFAVNDDVDAYALNQNQVGVHAVNEGGGINAREAYAAVGAAPASTIDDLLRARAEAFRRS